MCWDILRCLPVCSMREDVYLVVKAFAEKKVPLSPQAQRFVDRLVSACHVEFCSLAHSVCGILCCRA
jgi:hypothetical protein